MVTVRTSFVTPSSQTPSEAATSRSASPGAFRRIPELDGIRGAAIFLVLVWHYIINTVRVPPHSWQSWFLFPFRLTWSGVDLFFVLSGFLIGGILVDAKNDNVNKYYSAFYLRRLHRIVPVYAIWLALFCVALYVAAPMERSVWRTVFNKDLPVWSYWLFFQNAFMSSRQTFGAQWTGVTWSLAVEEQFYLLLPLLIRRSSNAAMIRGLIVAIVVAPFVRLTLWSSGNPYYGPYTLLPCRADSLACGVLAAYALRNERIWIWIESHRKHCYGAFGALAAGVAFLTLKHSDLLMNSIGYTWIAAFYTALLVVAVVKPSRVESRVLRSPLLVKLGMISYGVYITHQGVNYVWHGILFGQRPTIHDWQSTSVTALSLLTVICLCSLSWRFFERPILQHARARFRFE